MPDTVDIDPSSLSDEQLAAFLREAGRRANARHRKADCTCRICGEVIPDALLTKRYCSDACRQRARYWRTKDPETDPTAPFRVHLLGKGWQEARRYSRKPAKKARKRS